MHVIVSLVRARIQSLGLFTFLIVGMCAATAQTVNEDFPKTLYSPNDTVWIRYHGFPGRDPYRISTNKVSPGTNASLNGAITVYYGEDSVRIPYNNNLPFQHNIFIKLESPQGKSTLRFHYNEIASWFSDIYTQRNVGNVQFDIPEVYELANIIWALSPGGQGAKSQTLQKESDYYKRVITYFKPYQNHPIFKELTVTDNVYYKKYVDFRENSFAYRFKDTKKGSADATMISDGPYYYVFGDSMAYSSLFGRLKPLVEDFARKSKFRKFYNDNLPYYTKAIQREKELLPVREMWKWIEVEFPKEKYQSYRIVFSPLIGGTHSTQRYRQRVKNGVFGENVMFISGTETFDRNPAYTEKQKEGLMSGIVFTEIDHNYVNPTTDRYAQRVDSIFAKRTTWVKESDATRDYNTPYSVFNEYMTHALFCLWVEDYFDRATADVVIGYREKLMVDSRNFIRFREFNQELIRLRKEHNTLKAVDLYPFILDWCKTQG